MAERAIAVLGDAAAHRRMSQCAAERARHFSPERVVPQYVQLYETLLSG